MKGSKMLKKLAAMLLIVGLLGAVACVFALLLMLLWNVVIVSALANATSVTFLTALGGAAIFYGILTLANLIRSAAQGYMQAIQMRVAMKTMQQYDKNAQEGDENAQAEKGDDILRHFRMGSE